MKVCKYLLFLFLCCPVLAIADVPQLINYQGRLIDAGGNPQTGSVSISFSLYDAATEGELIWGPQTFDDVTLVDGSFNVILGPEDENNLSLLQALSDGSRFIEISQSGNPILPRQQVLSAPFAVRAHTADIALIANDSQLVSGKNISSYVTPVYLRYIAGSSEGACTPNSYVNRRLNTCTGIGVTNTESCEGIDFISLDNNAFLLSEGSYVIEAKAPSYAANGHVIRIIGGTVDISGQVAFGSDSVGITTFSTLNDSFTIDSPTTFRLQHKCQNNGADSRNDFGRNATFGMDIYSEIKIQKID